MSRSRARWGGHDAKRAHRALVVLCLVLGLGGCIWLGPSYAKVMRPPTDPRPDYFQDWASARNFRVGLPIYTPHSTTMPDVPGTPPGGTGKRHRI